MNKTISINIAGFVFNIEEQAYEKLRRYLESIKRNFRNEDDCEEIMLDIEARIAELFHEKLSDLKEVIIDPDVEGVILIMGKPEDYLSEETADNFKAEEGETEYIAAEEVGGEQFYSQASRKRLYRDEATGSVGGVCSGLGWFFGLDPVLIRIGFVLLTVLGGSGILLYIILWIVIPEAKTTAEILEMQGEPVTLDSIKDHVQRAKGVFKTGAKESKKNIKKAVDKSVQVGFKLADSLSKVFGTVFIVGGVFALIVLFIILFGDKGLLPLVGSGLIEDLPTMLEVIYPDGRSGMVFLAIIMVTIIPIVAGIFLGIKLLFGITAKFRKVNIAISIIWFLGAATLALTGVELGMNFRNLAEIDYDVPVAEDSTDILYVDVIEDDIFSNYIEYQQVWNYSELIRVQNEKVYLGYPELRIVAGPDNSNFNVTLFKKSHGLYQKEAIHKAERIRYDLNTSGNLLTLAPYFSINQEERMRNQKVVVEIQVPIGKKVKFGDNVDRILVKVSDDDYHHNETFASTTWSVDVKGLKCIECKDRRVYQED